MNTPTPAQALGAVIALSARERELTGDDWLEAYRAFTDASRNLVNQHGQHFAGLAADAERTASCPWRVQKGCTSMCQPPKSMRDALARAEAAEARCAELETELNSALHEISCCDDVNLGVPLAQSIGELQQHRERLEARVREAEGLLRELSDNHGGHVNCDNKNPNGIDGDCYCGWLLLKERIAAFLAARG